MSKVEEKRMKVEGKMGSAIKKKNGERKIVGEKKAKRTERK